MTYTLFFPNALDEAQSVRNLAIKVVVIIGDGVGMELAFGFCFTFSVAQSAYRPSYGTGKRP